MRLLQGLEATVLATGEAAPIYRRSWLYRGTPNRYFTLAADDVRLLRAEVAKARDALLTKALTDLFLPGEVERHSGKEQPEGSVWTILPPGTPVPG